MKVFCLLITALSAIAPIGESPRLVRDSKGRVPPIDHCECQVKFNPTLNGGGTWSWTPGIGNRKGYCEVLGDFHCGEQQSKCNFNGTIRWTPPGSGGYTLEWIYPNGQGGSNPDGPSGGVSNVEADCALGSDMQFTVKDANGQTVATANLDCEPCKW